MFTPVETSIGALLLHQASSNLLYQNGNILGVSGYLRQLLSMPRKDIVAFFAGMAASYVPLQIMAPHILPQYAAVSMSLQTVLWTAGVGLLVGWGTKVCLIRKLRQHKLTRSRLRMAVHPGICSVVSHD